MFGDILLSNSYVAIALAAGFAAGAVLSRLLASVGSRSAGKRADDLNHRIRALDADLRVAQRRADELKAERDAVSEELGAANSELGTLREQASAHDAIVRKLKVNIQQECEKTSQLRMELAERAEEMVRTHVQLREAKTELGVTQAGASVDTDQIARLERERDEMSTKVEALKKQMAAMDRGQTPGGSTITLDVDGDLLVDD